MRIVYIVNMSAGGLISRIGTT